MLRSRVISAVPVLRTHGFALEAYRTGAYTRFQSKHPPPSDTESSPMGIHRLIRLLVFYLFSIIARFLFPSTPGPSILNDDPPKGLVKAERPVHLQEKSGEERESQRQVTINMLPDIVLLEIFDFTLKDLSCHSHTIWTWAKLVHVCRLWRRIVFGSPQRLQLRVACSFRTPTRTSLDIWPALPIVIRCLPGHVNGDKCEENIVAALEQHERISEIYLYVPNSVLARFAAVMQEPLPALTRLHLKASKAETATVLPEEFLGGSVPGLRSLYLDGIPFPELPKLLLSARDLVHLRLFTIPRSGYVSPEVMATCLAALTRLESLHFEFESPRSHPEEASRYPPLPTSTLLPALTNFQFQGVSEYLEDLVTRIDAPRLGNLRIKFFNRLSSELSQLPRFVSRPERFKAFNGAHISFYDRYVDLLLTPQVMRFDNDLLYLMISSTAPDWQLASMAQVCNSSFPLHPTLEYLYILKPGNPSPHWRYDMENAQWLEFLYPFAGVKNLYLGMGITLHVALALQELTEEGATMMLPALQNLFLEGLLSSGPVQEAIGKFVAVRQLSGHPVAVHRWDWLEEMNWTGQ
ncbi:hypothetical protein BJV74DRAFT_952934 [Russula compacta]|nr:hypothetical protein BJV74DRAFT_952934 [Russula compacta]